MAMEQRILDSNGGAGARGFLGRLRFGATLLAGLMACSGGSGGLSGSTSPPPPPPPAPKPVVLASGVDFLPPGLSSANQLRASLVPANGSLFFADSSDSPVKRLDLGTGSVLPLARRVGTPTRLALQGSSVLWTDGARLVATSLNGSGEFVLADGNVADTPAVLADADAAYWVRTLPSTTCSPPCIRNVERVTAAGTLVLAQVAQPVVALAQDATSIYWEESDPGPVIPGCNCGSMIKRVPKAGGAVAVVVDAFLNGLIVPPAVGLPGAWLPVGGLATDGSSLFFADTGYASDRVLSAPTAGGAVTALVTLSHAPYDVSVQPTHVTGDAAGVFWTDAAALNWLSSPGGTPTPLVGGLQSPADLVLGPDTLLLVEAGALSQSMGWPIALGTGRVRILRRAGGAASLTITGLDAPSAGVLDSSAVYWTEAWRVGSAPQIGATPTTLASGIRDPLPRIAVTGQSLLVADGPFLKTLPIGGGRVEKIGLILDVADGPSSGQRAADLVTDGTDAFVAYFDAPSGPAARRISLGAGQVTDYFPPYITTPQNCVARVAADGQYVYWTTGDNLGFPCAIARAPRGGGPSSVLVDRSVIDFALMGQNVFFTTLSSWIIDQTGAHRIGSDGLSEISADGVPVASESLPGFPNLMTADAKRVAWMDGTGGLDYQPLSLSGDLVFTGPAPESSVFIPGWVDDLVSDGSSLYFTDMRNGTISRLTPGP